MDSKEQTSESLAMVIRQVMSIHRLSAKEVAESARVSVSSLTRYRRLEGAECTPRPQTLRRLADALGDLSHADAEEIYHDLMHASGQASRLSQGDLGIRGAAELVSNYQRMNTIGRHLLLEQARLLARELPDRD